MTFRFTLQKLLTVKENEKNELEREYQRAYIDFEKIAKVLYAFMKQKEYLEELRSKHMGKGAVVGRIQNLQFDLERLEEKIRRHEALFLDARQIAERMKARLLERSIDVKRYEKLKDIEYEQFLKKLKAEEMSRMDEISTTRYAHR